MIENTRPEGTFPIQTVCKATGVSRSTILRMEEDGLLTPRYKDPQSGYRYYDITNLSRIIQILIYQGTGLTRKAILDISTRPDLMEKYLDELLRKYAQIITAIDRLSGLLNPGDQPIIREIVFPEGYFLRFRRRMENTPRNIQKFFADCLLEFTYLGEQLNTDRLLHFYVDDENHPGTFDGKMHDCCILVPVVNPDIPGADIVHLPRSKAVALSARCNIYDCDHVFAHLRSEIKRRGYTSNGPLRLTVFPDVVSLTRTPDHFHSLSLLMMVK